jgi:hypothetical protein
MAASARSFTRPDDEIIVATTPFGGGFTAYTLAAIVKTADTTNLKVILSVSSFDPSLTFTVNADESVGVWDSVSARSSAASRIVSGRWHLVAFTHAAGTTTGRFHIYDYTTTTWVHENAGGTSPNTGALTDNDLWIGQDNNSGGNGWSGEIQAAAIFTTSLSDGNLEGMVSGPAAWGALSPAAFWPLDQDSTATPVKDMGGTADQTGITGTTIGTGNPDWRWPPASSDNSDATIITTTAARMR